MNDSVIAITNLTRRFGKIVALDAVNISVPRGVVLGLVGENAAGKTTLIKHVLGLLVARTGRVEVFGLDPAADPVGVLGRIGYLSEDRDLPEWMRVRELMRYTQAFFPNWDEAYAEKLRETFDLDAQQKVKELSRGQRAQAGLLIALAHRPDLLVLDEASSGLDPVVRRDILAAIIRTVADEGRTVLFSSHLLDEVERVADEVAMIHRGRIVLSASLENIKETHRRVTVRFDEPQDSAPKLPGTLWCAGEGLEWIILCDGEMERLKSAAEAAGAAIVDERIPTLDEVFVARVKA